MPLHWRDWVKDQHLAGREAGWWRFGERVGHGGWLIGPKLFRPKAYLTWVSSRLCKFIFRLIFKPLPFKNIALVSSLETFRLCLFHHNDSQCHMLFKIINIILYLFLSLYSSFDTPPKIGHCSICKGKIRGPFYRPQRPSPPFFAREQAQGVEPNFFPHQYICKQRKKQK